MNWLRRLFTRDRLERELDAEMAFHVEEEAARLQEDGVPPDEARRRALAAFGGLEPIREQARDARGTQWVLDLSRDLQYAVRMMRRAPVFAATALLSLAIGIGANAAIYSLIDALVVRPLPVDRPDELVFLNRAGHEEPNLRFSYPLIQRLRAEVPEIGLAAATPATRFQVTGEDASDLVLAQLVSGNFFSLLGLQPAAGRLFSERDNDQIDAHPVVVLSHQYWTRRFAGDASAVGRSTVVNGMALTIVGVAPEDFSGVYVGTPIDIWVPLMMQHALRHRGNASTDGVADASRPWAVQQDIAWLRALARVPPALRTRAETGFGQALRQRIDEQLEHETNPTRREYRDREHLAFIPGGRGLSDLRENFAQPLGVLMGTVALVLLIACANLAGLLLARSRAREREFSLRLSLGAGRGRLIRQLLTESLLLSAGGGLLGLGIARLGGQLLLRLASSTGAPIPLEVPFDARLLVFTAAVSLLTGVGFGLAPALRLSRPDPGHALRGAGRLMGRSARASGVGMGQVLMAGQVALSLVLLAGALLCVQTFFNLLDTEAGFDRDQVLSARVEPGLAALEVAELPAFYTQLLERARGLPGVERATLAASGPLTGSRSISGISVEGRDRSPGSGDAAREEFVGPDFFPTLGVPLLRGRVFDPSDDGGPLVGVVNEAFVRAFLADRDPLGTRFGYSADRLDREIVGVVSDARVDGARSEAPPLIYYPLAQHPDIVVRNLYVRVAGAPELTRRVAPLLERVVGETDRRVAVREVVTLGELNERSVNRERLVSQLTAGFAALAVAVACLGLFGTVSYAVARRTNEIGVRLALGASAGSVRWMVVREILVLVGAGCLAGVGLALLSLRALNAMLFGLSAHDPATLAAAAVVLLGVGMLAAAVPAWRASRVNPVVALRSE